MSYNKLHTTQTQTISTKTTIKTLVNTNSVNVIQSKSQRKFSPINIEILGDTDGYSIQRPKRSKSIPAYYTKVNTEELSIEENLSNSVSDDDGITDEEIWNIFNNKEEFNVIAL